MVLKKFNFGTSFIKWVNTIYNGTESCITNNGWTSKAFPIKKGIRQGCLLSALLFLLVVEILAINIRKTPEDGLEIGIQGQKKYVQISQLADNMTLFVKDEAAVVRVLKS